MSEARITKFAHHQLRREEKATNLTWVDTFATVIAIVVAVAMVAKIRDYNWTFIGSWRTAIGSIGFLGLLAAIYEEADFEHFNAWGALEWLLAAGAVALTIAGLIVNTKVFVVLLAADILALWAASIARHTFVKEKL